MSEFEIQLYLENNLKIETEDSEVDFSPDGSEAIVTVKDDIDGQCFYYR